MLDIYRRRCEKLTGILRETVDGLFLFPGPNMGYLTGFQINPSDRLSAAILPLDGDPALVVPWLERELRGQTPWVEEVLTWNEHEDPIELIVQTLRRKGLDDAKIGLEEHVWWGVINKIACELPQIQFVDVSKEIYSLRMIKVEEELQCIRKASSISNRALVTGFENLCNEMTELELASIISREMTRLGGTPNLGIVLFGPRTALPHGQPGQFKLKAGEVVLVDTGTTWNGYWSDISRTVFFGEPSERYKKVWRIVMDANRRAFEAVVPGVSCQRIDRIARRLIYAAGFGEYFIHRVGHGIGLQGHEHPYLVEGNALELQSGMTFTIEPGIYIFGEMGVRIEDAVICTEAGGESLTDEVEHEDSFSVTS